MEIEESKLSIFFHSLQGRLESDQKFKETYNKEYAFEFNPLIHFYGIGENKLSDILAFFLNPKEKHGQGRIFLELFLTTIFASNDVRLNGFLASASPGESLSNRFKEIKQVNIYREKQTIGLKRLDLLLELIMEDNRKKYGIGIENKIWAGDQNNQLRDYNTWLSKEYEQDYSLLYLTPYGHNPSETSLSKKDFDELKELKKLYLVKYDVEMVNLIEAWAEKCQASRVRQFLKDFHQYIKHTINGNIFMTEHKTIKDFILEGNQLEAGNKLEIAFGVQESMNLIRDALIEELKNQMSDLANHVDMNLVGFNLNREPNWTGFSFQFKDGARYHGLTIRFEWTKSTPGFYGIIHDPNELSLSEFINKNLGEGNVKAWQWARKLDKYENFWNQTFIDIQNGEFKEFIHKKLNEIIEKMSN